ncbi:transcriptional regulator [Mycobacterium sp. JS623]|uniref:IclR family transcriptional regulator n=1 Tax=Mycobacterium sp. JS623 TaxID=212767 RepID=UPI0002A57BCE|nr:IclR family transcriptional regulator C-terminal domain-containing protein [Mycobacterium sp. JS623]AGB25607.1 transcriptional regulator [Mycobacterium sp. JS623]
MSPADGTLSGRQPKAVQSALRVLEEVARAGVGVTAKEIAENLSMPSATAYRLLNLLVAEGYIVRLPDLSGFSLGHRMGVLIDAAVAPTVCTAAREVLSEVRLSVRFGVHLFYFTNTAVRAADLDSEFPPPVGEAVLNRNLHRSAVGRLLLAEKQHLDGLVPVSEELLATLDAVRQQGFATQTGELREDCACVAVPVRAPSGALVAALGMSGRADQDLLLTKQVPALTECAALLSPLLA